MEKSINTQTHENDTQKAITLINQAIEEKSDTLRIRNLSDLTRIPDEIGKLTHLKHLYLEKCWKIKDIERTYALKNLETLVLEDHSMYDVIFKLSNFPHLKTLEIADFDFDNKEQLLELTSLKELEELHIIGHIASGFVDLTPDEGSDEAEKIAESEYERRMQEYSFPKDLKKLEKLKYFEFNYCEYSMDNVLKVLIQMPALRKLRLRAEGFPSLLPQLTQIEELDLSHFEHLEKLPEEIGNLQNLKVLDLSSDVEKMIIEELPDSFYKLRNLEELYLYDCINITHFKEEFQNLNKLHTLHTVGSSIFQIPFSSTQLQNLQKIGIQGKIPDLSSCKNLKQFYYYKNQVGWHIVKGNYGTTSEFDFKETNIETLSQLEELRIMGGKLMDTSFLSKLTALKRLFLSCDLTNLPEDIDMLEHLEEIEITYAYSLTRLPKNFSQLKSLKSLCIKNSKIEDLSKYIDKLPSLEMLNYRLIK